MQCAGVVLMETHRRPVPQHAVSLPVFLQTWSIPPFNLLPLVLMCATAPLRRCLYAGASETPSLKAGNIQDP